jgi:branched-chain amino acid transport system ATP-binding protein
VSTPLSKAKAQAEADRDRDEQASRAQHLAAAEGALVRLDDVVAGYVPGVNILNGCDLHCDEGELVGIIGPERRRASPRCSRRCWAW